MPRTFYQTNFEIDYALRLCLRHRKFYGHLRSVFMFINLFGTTAAVTAVFAKSPDIALIAGLVLSAVSVIDRVIDPAKKRASFVQDYKRYAKVQRAIVGKSPADAEKLLLAAREDDSDAIEALRDVAYNDVLLQQGSAAEYMIKLGIGKRLIAAVA